MHRRSFLALVGSAGLSGCAGIGSSASRTPEYDVGMRETAFAPREIEVRAGEVVTWLNVSTRPHTVTAYDDGVPADAEYFATGGYESERAAREAYYDDLGGAVYTDETYDHEFVVPGTYHYLCIPHEAGGMIGRVTVEE